MMLHWRFPEQHRTPLIKNPSLHFLEFDVYSRKLIFGHNEFEWISLILDNISLCDLKKKGKRLTRVNFRIFLSILLSIK